MGSTTVRRLTLIVLCTAAFTLLSAAPAAGLVLRMSTAQLTDTSARVLIVKAVSSESRWTDPNGASLAAKGTIVTDVRLNVYEVLKGTAPSAMTITVPGGSVGRVSIPVEDAPRFVAGQFYVVFLASSGQVVAWREGQPQVVGTQVPELHQSLSQLKVSVAARVGHPAKVLRQWKGIAPSEPVAEPRPAEVVSQTAATAPIAAPESGVKMGVGPAPSPTGMTLAPPQKSASGVAPRGTATLFQDNFESMNMNKWNMFYKTPVVTNECYFSNSFWEDNQYNDYWYAYSAAQRADYYVGGMWFWALQLPYPGLSYYGTNDSTYMVTKTPVNLSGYPYGIINFDLWCHTAGAGDTIGVYLSKTGGNDFYGYYWYGDEGSDGDPPAFSPKSLDLRNWPAAGGGTQNLCGGPVYIEFYFASDSSYVSMGGCVDNVELVGSTTPIPVIDNINPPSAPSGTYYEPARNQSRVTITGSGFGSSEGRVAFFYQDGEPLINGVVRSWSNTSITCDVPIGIIHNYAASAGSGPVQVVTAGGVWSGGYSFDVPYSYGNEDWEASRCMYRLNTGSMVGNEAAAIDAATNAWNNVGSGFLFQDIGTCTTTPKGTGSSIHMPLDGHNDMVFADASGLPGVIAFASPIEVNGRMLEVDIVFNTGGGFDWATNGSGSAMDVQTIATHETGHWLNLRDLYGPGDTARIMYGFCDVGILKRSLTQGEVDGIDWIYADHSTDTAPPVGQARSSSVYRGKTARVKFEINDPYPSIGISTVQVVIKSRSGKTVKSKNTWVFTRIWYTWSFRCRLAKGRYSIVVTGTDQLGNATSRSVKGYLTVK
jgi:hypothetical protein